MKKLFLIPLMLILFVSFSFPQGTTTKQETPYGYIVNWAVPITLAKTATQYSEEFNLSPYLWGDSTKPVGYCTWQSNDTIQVTLTLQVKNAYVPGSVTSGSWQDAVTLVSVQANAGNDTLWARQINQRGTVASGVTDIVTMAGKVGNQARLKVVFANPTTIGNSGTLRTWLYLTKKF